MEKLLIAFFSAVITFGFIYLLGCFSEANFDIHEWQEDTRFCVALFGGLFSFVALFLVADRKNF